MIFNKGDKVTVIAKKADWCMWVPDLDKYVNDGKTYIVEDPTDADGDTYVFVGGNGRQYWYFPMESLKLVNDNPYMDKVESTTREVTTYAYDGNYCFENRNQLLRHVFTKIVSEFLENGVNVTTEKIDIHIKKMNQLKELCQNLK